ncbi:MAG: HAD-IA family hydrolase [Candidatus Omnitrophica bacterium]|nr:HAD-IA family hydrolase [Candidatus Omnitrophota bacterium]
MEKRVAIKGVIFDFDGTIVNLSIDFKKIKERILKEAKNFNFKIPSKSLPVLEFLEKIRKLNGKNGEDFFVIGHKILKEEEIKASKKTYPKKGVLELLKNLKEQDIKIGIITRNCREVVEKVINRFNIPYDIILTRDDIERVKPDPLHIKECLRKLGLKKNEVILVGDHFLDIRCGKKLNILSIGISNKNIKEYDFFKEGADFVFDDIKEVEYILNLKGFPTGKLPNKFLKYLLTKYTTKDKDVIVLPGIGVDCSIFKFNERYIFSKTDPITLTSKDIGFYLVNINVNDISVMGGIPLYFLCVLLFPKNITFSEIESVFSQISKECKKFKIKWVGGHTEIISDIKNPIGVGFLIGRRIKKIYFSNVKVGDKVFLIKEIGIEGASILAREKFKDLKKYFSEDYILKVQNSILKPGISIFKEAKLLWQNFKIKWMHDPTEGGISTALYEVSESKKIGILIDLKKLNFYPATCKFCKVLGLNPLGIISSGCIIGIIDKRDEKEIIEFCKKNKIKFKIIGEVIKEKGVYYFENGEIFEFPRFKRDEINKIF